MEAARAKAPATEVRLKIRRQDGPDQAPYWEEFVLPYEPGLNIIACLMEIRKNPVNRAGQKTSPPAFLAACLEEVCGSCTMLVNGRARQACSTLVDEFDLSEPIVLEPMTKFPVVRDLIVDRQRMFDALKKLHIWIPIQGTYHLGEGPKMSPAEAEFRYHLSKCMTCGVCLEVCPQYGPHSDFLGAAALSQVVLMNAHPTGRMNAEERLDIAAGPGGITQCGNAQNCVRSCPKEIPLTTSLAKLQREVVIHRIKKALSSGWLGRP